MRVLVTGGTGFTGRRVVEELIGSGHRVRCLVRPGSDRSRLAGSEVEFVTGDLRDRASLARAMRGADALMNVASIGFGHAPGVVRSALEAGMERAVFFSTTAIFTTLPATSRKVRLEAEEAIRRSPLAYTILRPTMIYGAPGDRNVERLLRAVRRLPVMVLPGRGERKIQPVLVDDLARAAAAVIREEATAGRAYQVPGRSAVSFRRFVLEAAAAAGTRVRLLPLPPALLVGTARLTARLSARPRLRAEQVLRLLEDKDFDWTEARRDFGYEPSGVRRGLRIEARRLFAGARETSRSPGPGGAGG